MTGKMGIQGETGSQAATGVKGKRSTQVGDTGPQGLAGNYLDEI